MLIYFFSAPHELSKSSEINDNPDKKITKFSSKTPLSTAMRKEKDIRVTIATFLEFRSSARFINSRRALFRSEIFREINVAIEILNFSILSF